METNIFYFTQEALSFIIAVEKLHEINRKI